jgi:hypothetical protein
VLLQSGQVLECHESLNPPSDWAHQSNQLSPARLDEHEADTFREHVLVNMLSPW